MKTLKFLFLYSSIPLFLLIFSSCEKDLIHKKSQDKLLVESIEIKEGMYYFKDKDEFIKVKQDLYLKYDRYKEYFEQNSPIDNPQYSFDQAMLEIDLDHMTEEDFSLFRKKWKNKISFENNSVAEKFDFSYKNYLCRYDGVVNIGGIYYKYLPEYKMFSKSNDLQNLIMSEPSNLDDNIVTISLISKELDFEKVYKDKDVVPCAESWDGKRRIETVTKVDLDNDGGGFACMTRMGAAGVIEIMNLEWTTRYQRKKFGVWWNRQADIISHTGDWDMFIGPAPAPGSGFVAGIHISSSDTNVSSLKTGLSDSYCAVSGLCNSTINSTHEAKHADDGYDDDCSIVYSLPTILVCIP